MNTTIEIMGKPIHLDQVEWLANLPTVRGTQEANEMIWAARKAIKHRSFKSGDEVYSRNDPQVFDA